MDIGHSPDDRKFAAKNIGVEAAWRRKRASKNRYASAPQSTRELREKKLSPLV